MQKTTRYYVIDFLKLTAILGVILIHTSTAFIDKSIHFSLQFYFLVFINQLFRFSVPLFFAASGIILALIYNKHFSTITFYKKRLLRILPPYIFWFLVYYFLVYPHPLSKIFSESFIKSFLYGEASYQFYFIPIIVILYALFPIFIKFKEIFLSKFFLTFLAIVTVIFLSFVYYGNFKPTSISPLRGTLYNIFPFLVGMYIGVHYEKVSKLFYKQKTKFLFLSLFSGLLLIAETLSLFAITNADRFLRDQWRFTVVAYTCFVSVSLFNIYDTYLKKFQMPIEYLAKLSFGVFFIHVCILNIALKQLVQPFNIYTLGGFIVTTMLVLGVSFGIMAIVSRIPYVGKIISAT